MAYGDDDASPGSAAPVPFGSGPGAFVHRARAATSLLLPSHVWTTHSPAVAASAFRTLYSTLTFVVVAASAVVFAYLFVAASQPGGDEPYRSLLKEDGLFEYIGALLFLLTSMVLFYCAYRTARRRYDGPRIHKLLFFLAGLVFLLGAGEEISWGQRLFALETPQYLAEINGQQETNFHNINKKLFDRAVTYATVFLIVMSLVLHALKITSVFRLKIPSVLLVVSLCLVAAYKQYYQPFYGSGAEILNSLHFAFNQDAIVTSLVFASLLAVIALSIARRDEYGAWLTLFGAFFVVCFSLLLMSLHVEMRDAVTTWFNHINEVREYLLAVCLFMYSLELSSEFRRHSL